MLNTTVILPSTILVGIDHFGHVIENGNSERIKVALPPNLVTRSSYGTKLVAILPVWAFDDGRGPGCPYCCEQGDVGVYQRRDVDPYIRLMPCPHCFKPE